MQMHLAKCIQRLETGTMTGSRIMHRGALRQSLIQLLPLIPSPRFPPYLESYFAKRFRSTAIDFPMFVCSEVPRSLRIEHCSVLYRVSEIERGRTAGQ
jgi:hypothetical protein